MSLDLDKTAWRRVKFGDVVRNVNNTAKDPWSLGIDRVIAMEHMDPGELGIERWGDVADGTTFTRVVTPGQTLFGKRRAYQRKVAYAEFDAICSGDIYTFEAIDGELVPELLPFLVQSERFFDHALGTSAGSLSPRTNWRDLANFEFDLPPVQEQVRLAGLLWAILKPRESCRRVVDHLRRSRTIFLNTFVNSVANWSPVGSFDNGEDPAVQVGPFGGSLASRHFTDSGVRVMKIQNISRDGAIDLGYSVHVSPEHAASLARYSLARGDTLIVAQGATVGKSAIVEQDLGDALISQHLIRVRLDERQVLPRFFSLMVQCDAFQRQIGSVRTKTTRDGLNTADVSRFLIPDVSPSTQAHVVSSISEIDNAITCVTSERAALDGLAFRTLGEIFGGN